jgi:hypothetical protein
VPSFIKEHKKCQSLSQKLASIFVWKIVRTQLPVVDKDNHLLLLGDGARKEAAGVEQYVLVRGE